jgi:thiamine biosynthesis lipoprotein
MSATPRSTRREFLQGQAAADALAEAIAPADVDSGTSPPNESAYLLHVSRRAMACNFELFFNAGQYPHATETALAALDLVDRLEDQLSVYREHSEVSQLNRRAGQQAIPLERALFDLLAQASRLCNQTAGAYDITAAPLSEAWGFTRRNGAIPSAEALSEALARVGGKFMELDEASSSVHFARPDLKVNLGSIGKGYAIDRCAELLAEAGIHDFLLHGGNSSVLARGAHGSLAPQQGWAVGVRNPLRPERRLGQLFLRDRALATSGSGTQFFMHDGRRYGHIIDPRSGWPADGVLSVSVLAPTAAEADALSTAFYVMGLGATREYCARRPEIATILLCPGTRQGSLEKHAIGLEDGQWMDDDDRERGDGIRASA